MKNKFKYFLILLLFLVSCSEGNEDDLEIIKITKGSSIYDSKKYVITLETSGPDFEYLTNDSTFKVGDRVKLVKY